MARKGPVRQPLKIAELKGTARKRKYRDGDTAEVTVPGKMPTCPTKLTAAAKVEWKRIAAILGTVEGMVKGTDRVVLAGYCRSWARAMAYDEIVERDGGILEDKGGKLYRHPAIQVADAAWLAALRFAQELGFSPASRSRVRVPDKKASAKAVYKGHAG